jgi:hypothetical protein
MGALFRFAGVRCEGSDRARTFTLRAGETRLLQLASRREKQAMIDSAIGEAVCASGSIEIVQGDRRHKIKSIIGKFVERRHNSGPIPLIWQPVLESLPGRAGWVAANGGLISNLRIWENVTLPLWYHARREPVETEQRIRHWLGMLGLEQQEFEAFMAAQPHRVEPWQRKLAGLLRALLLLSPVLVVDAFLFEDIKARLADCWIRALETYAAEGRTVLAIADNATMLSWERFE